MADGFGNDAFQWKNSAHKTYSLGIGISNTNTDDDTHRVTDTDTDRDVETHQELLSPEQKAKLEEMVCMFTDHFATMITFDHRAEIRDRATCFWQYAKDELYDAIYAETDNIIDNERRILEEELCSKVATLNSIGGTTRSCFAQTIVGKTLSENSVAMAALKSNANIQARQLEAQTIAQSFAASYQAFVEGDAQDYNKYMQALQLLRGACVDETVAEDIAVDTVDDINRDVNVLAINSQFNRTVGSISDTQDTYQADIDALIAANGALG